MKHVDLGALEVARIGLGAMGMSAAYTGAGTDEAESIRAIHSSRSVDAPPVVTQPWPNRAARRIERGSMAAITNGSLGCCVHPGIIRASTPE